MTPTEPPIFYLGTHMPSWLRRAKWPLFVSARRLRGYRKLMRAVVRWSLDSGGFTELKMYGEWRTPPQQYVREVRRFRDEIGMMDWAAPQDWMCEPFMLDKTGLSVAMHQQLTLRNLLQLREIAPDLPFIPVLQGWTSDDYQRHADQYEAAGIDLSREPTVGVGSVCRRQATDEAERLLFRLWRRGYRLHAFGFKLDGLRRCADLIASADSMAWSFGARYEPPMPGCIGHKNCANCMRYAEAWRVRTIEAIGGRMDAPLALFAGAA